MATKKYLKRKGKGYVRGVATNRDGSKTMLKGKKGRGAKAISVWMPKKSKTGKVLVTMKKWVTKKQASKM